MQELIAALEEAKADLEALRRTMLDLKAQHEIESSSLQSALLAEETAIAKLVDEHTGEVEKLRQEKAALLEELARSDEKVGTLIQDFETASTTPPTSPMRELELVSSLDRATQLAHNAEMAQQENVDSLRRQLEQANAELNAARSQLAQTASVSSATHSEYSVSNNSGAASARQETSSSLVGPSRLPEHLEEELQVLALELQSTASELHTLRETSDVSLDEYGKQVDFYSKSVERLIGDKTSLQQENSMLLEELTGTKVQIAEVLEDYDKAKKQLFAHSK
jgi:chromosome segregation ATPase